MKNGKAPTRRQRTLINYYGLNPENWLVSKHTTDELVLINRYTNQEKIIPSR